MNKFYTKGDRWRVMLITSPAVYGLYMIVSAYI